MKAHELRKQVQKDASWDYSLYIICNTRLLSCASTGHQSSRVATSIIIISSSFLRDIRDVREKEFNESPSCRVRAKLKSCFSTKVTCKLKHAVRLTGKWWWRDKTAFYSQHYPPPSQTLLGITWGKYTDTGLSFVVCDSQAMMLLLTYDISQFLAWNI